MEYKIKGYEPKEVFEFFEEISAIPRSSGNEEAVSRYLGAFAQIRRLEYYTDELHNVVIKKPGTEGSEHLPAVMLQGHTDMVCEKNSDVLHDFDHDGIDLIVKDGTVTANGTTLGADNGVAVAFMLAILNSKSLRHPPLECVFTVQEETGLYGAIALDPEVITAKTMINLDSEEEGVATVSCAGGMFVNFVREIQREAVDGKALLKVSISGLLGGHSGADIHLEHTNANKLMGRFLYAVMQETEMQLVSLDGGSKDNAVPRECTAVLAFPSPGQYNKAEEILEVLIAETKEEILPTEPGYHVSLSGAEPEPFLMSREMTEDIVKAICLAPDGSQKRNVQKGGFIVSSLNLGVIKTGDLRFEMHFSPRSSVESLQRETRKTLNLLGETFHFEVECSGEYPGWKYAEVSPIRDIFCESYQRLFGDELKIEAIHAGLECGLFIGKIPELDAIAVGPTLRGCHTPDETLYLDSCGRMWKLLTDVLEILAK